MRGHVACAGVTTSPALASPRPHLPVGCHAPCLPHRNDGATAPSVPYSVSPATRVRVLESPHGDLQCIDDARHDGIAGHFLMEGGNEWREPTC